MGIKSIKTDLELKILNRNLELVPAQQKQKQSSIKREQ